MSMPWIRTSQMLMRTVIYIRLHRRAVMGMELLLIDVIVECIKRQNL